MCAVGAKSILSSLGLMGVAKRIRAAIKRPVRLLLNRLIWLVTRLNGGGYTDFYERMMDHRARYGSPLGKSAAEVTGHPDEPRRRFALDWFIARGWITPTTKFLDYGCGNAAAGINFIRYLGAGKYTGADISSGSLERAVAWVVKIGLAAKLPHFIHLPGGSMSGFGGRGFDLIYAQDVVTHMPPENIKALLAKMVLHMHKGSVFLLTYTHAGDDCEYQGDLVNWHHNARFFMGAVVGLPLACEEVPEWTKAGYKLGHVSRMVRFRLRP